MTAWRVAVTRACQGTIRRPDRATSRVPLIRVHLAQYFLEFSRVGPERLELLDVERLRARGAPAPSSSSNRCLRRPHGRWGRSPHAYWQRFHGVLAALRLPELSSPACLAKRPSRVFPDLYGRRLAKPQLGSKLVITSHSWAATHALLADATWEAAREFMARQPGYVSTRLHRGTRSEHRGRKGPARDASFELAPSARRRNR